ncbi:tetratricopeptide repeat protein [Vibrio sp. 03-59-1]|uniref:tetratricopeptide repeat protein n=1 Tax=Vibrio sp. 03-59-1 TaxID=2607607 RepID=UPI001493DAA3|nr:tetratricopeptide repeat protein [Vibrio sp. 03-59-1]NOH84325.1 tetratricopeptide repeat protein [Vibrio sp. 03-59-1]
MKRVFKPFLTAFWVQFLVVPMGISAELSQYTANRVQRAHQLQQDEKLSEAIGTLNDLEINRDYDKAFVARMLGVFYWQNEQAELAIEQLTFAVNSQLLEDAQAWVTRRMLADILLSQQHFEKAIPHYYELLKTRPDDKKGAELWLRVAQSHYQLSQWEKVLVSISKFDRSNRVNAHTGALSDNKDKNADATELTDKFSSLSLKLGAQMQLKRWKDAIPTLEQLIHLQPNKVNWWRQLVGLQLKLNKTDSALDSLALAKLQGVALSQQDLILLSQLYSKRGVPERAAQILSELADAESDVTLLSQQAAYWQQAKEWQHAISTWSLAAKLEPKYHWQVAQLLVQEGHYQRALSELDRVTEKERKADVALAKVRVYYKLNKLDKALANAKRADNIEPSSEAKNWMKYLTQLRVVSDSKSS